VILRGVFTLLLLLFALTLTGISAAHAQSMEYFSLEMSWLPGRCLVEPDLPACEGLSLTKPEGRSLSLIGLKPRARPGSTELRDCDPIARAFTTPVVDPSEKATACSLPAVRLSETLAASLGSLMPDIAACPERAFWAKYGACALLSQEHYFRRAVDRAEDLRRSLLNVAIAGAVGQRISRQVLVDAFEQQFGPESGRSLQIVCAKSKQHRQHVLTEVHVAINQLGSMKPLAAKSLWAPGGFVFKDKCPAEFLVAEPGAEEPALPEKPVIPDPFLPSAE
jgi:ribonuclease I